MMVRWSGVAAGAIVAPVIILFVTWIGFFNVGASTGHWKITEWFLELAMRSAVRTYALEVDVPETLDRRGLQPAAAHFARECAVCHGAPGEPRSPTVLRMLPRPPDLAATVNDWTDAELFRIVMHGIRFTGMPAWPTQQRDDEVWAMVVFLRELPRLDAGAYRDLAFGEYPSADAQASILDCMRCHGEDGAGRSAVVPVLAGQEEAYLLDSLQAYAEGRRPSGLMGPPAKSIPPAEMAALVQHFAALSQGAANGNTVPAELIEAGRLIAETGIAEQNVPACVSCHGAGPRNPAYPTLDGQHAPYLEAQLRLFRSRRRGGGPYWLIMQAAARNLTDEQIAAVSTYYSGLKPSEP